MLKSKQSSQLHFWHIFWWLHDANTTTDPPLWANCQRYMIKNTDGCAKFAFFVFKELYKMLHHISQHPAVRPCPFCDPINYAVNALKLGLSGNLSISFRMLRQTQQRRWLYLVFLGCLCCQSESRTVFSWLFPPPSSSLLAVVYTNVGPLRVNK